MELENKLEQLILETENEDLILTFNLYRLLINEIIDELITDNNVLELNPN